MPVKIYIFARYSAVLSFVLFFSLMSDFIFAGSDEEKNPRRKIELPKEECLDLMKLLKIDPWEKNCIERCSSSFFDSSDPNTTPSGKYRSVAWKECQAFHFQCRVLCNGYFVRKSCYEWFKRTGIKADPGSMRCVKDCEKSKNRSEKNSHYYNSQVACDSSECMGMCADNAHTVPEECYAWFHPIWNSLNKKDVGKLAIECGARCEEASTPQTYAYCPSYCEDLCQEFVYPYLFEWSKEGKHSKEDLPAIPDCEEIRNPGLFSKIKKWPKNPINILFAYLAKQKALKKSRDLFPDVTIKGKNCNPKHNGPGDAFRHCYWTCRMTKTMDSKKALDYSDWYEFYKPGPCEEAQMDYQNNRVGGEIGKSGGDCEAGCKNDLKLTILKEFGECQ